MRRKISDSVIVITGASSGIGRATAVELARHKTALVLAARQAHVLEEVASECRQADAKVLVVPTDVTREEEVKRLAQRAATTFGRIDAWVNDAAVTMLARFEDAPNDAFRRVIETNFFGTVNGARAALPYFREQGYGVLINIASVLGKVGAPYATAYVASKFAVTGFSESLRMELLETPDIHVCTILPATIDTPLFQHAANYTGREVAAPPPVYSPEDVADAIIDCIRHPRREVPVGNARRMIAMRRVAPPLGERVVARKIDKDHFSNKVAPSTEGNLFEPMPEFNAVHGGWNGHARHRGHLVAGLTALAGAAAGYWWLRKSRH